MNFDVSKKQSMKLITVILTVAFLSAAILAAPASALLSQNATSWFWTSDTNSDAVAVGDVNGDGVNEIVTAGYNNNLLSWGAMLVVWNGATLAPISSMGWNWGANTQISSVAVANISGGKGLDIITAGSYDNGANDIAMLVVWNGSSLAPERAMSWNWGVNTWVSSVAVGNVTGGKSLDIVTTGKYSTATNDLGMLIVWNGSTLVPLNSKSWSWGVNTDSYSVAVGNVTGGNTQDIVTTGTYSTATNPQGMLIVWNGSTLVPLKATNWLTGLNTTSNSVAVGNLTGGNTLDIITGGSYNDGVRNYAQVIQWNRATLTAGSTATWFTISDTTAYSVTVGNLGTGNRIVESGQFWDNSRANAQLTIWG
jgi:hypothetical protein